MTQSCAHLTGFDHQPLDRALGELPGQTEDLWIIPDHLTRLPKPKRSFLLRKLSEAEARVKTVRSGLEQNGLDAARALAGKDTPAAAALEAILPGQGPAAAGEALEEMARTLARMKEELVRTGDPA